MEVGGKLLQANIESFHAALSMYDSAHWSLPWVNMKPRFLKANIRGMMRGVWKILIGIWILSSVFGIWILFEYPEELEYLEEYLNTLKLVFVITLPAIAHYNHAALSKIWEKSCTLSGLNSRIIIWRWKFSKQRQWYVSIRLLIDQFWRFKYKLCSSTNQIWLWQAWQLNLNFRDVNDQ